MNISAWVLCGVLVVVAVRRIGHLHIAIWQAMSAGAAVVLLTGQIGWHEALRAIDADVMLFLTGMFVVGQALVDSGYLYVVAYRLFSRLRSTDGLVLALLFSSGLISALLMNDTLAIIGTPLVLRLAREHRLDPTLMLLALAFAVTTGSVLSPIGNPQNLLIAVHAHLSHPFLTFVQHLALPGLLGLSAVYAVLRLQFRAAFHSSELVHAPVAVSDPDLARWARRALVIVIALILVNFALGVSDARYKLPLSAIALGGAIPILLGSKRRWRLLREIDWRTLLFFAALFVLMASVWRSGIVQGVLATAPFDVTGIPGVLAVSVLLSQLISNVPLVALYLPVLHDAGAGTQTLMALAAGSTLAGNLLILGAASNVIIVQGAERRGVRLSFAAFVRAGLPLTLLQVALVWALL